MVNLWHTEASLHSDQDVKQSVAASVEQKNIPVSVEQLTAYVNDAALWVVCDH